MLWSEASYIPNSCTYNARQIEQWPWGTTIPSIIDKKRFNSVLVYLLCGWLIYMDIKQVQWTDMIHGCNHKATFLPNYYLTLFSVGLVVTCCWIKTWAVLFALRLRNYTVVTLDRKTQFQFNNHEYSSHVTKKNPDLDLKLRLLLFPSWSLARRSL